MSLFKHILVYHARVTVLFFSGNYQRFMCGTVNVCNGQPQGPKGPCDLTLTNERKTLRLLSTDWAIFGKGLENPNFFFRILLLNTLKEQWKTSQNFFKNLRIRAFFYQNLLLLTFGPFNEVKSKYSEILAGSIFVIVGFQKKKNKTLEIRTSIYSIVWLG